MKLLQRYIFVQALVPTLLCLSALALLALLTQSLQTLDLIVENRQTAGTFFFITLLSLPQLLAVILPLAVFIATLYALNRLTSDSELTVAKANGVSPWAISTPVVRLGVYAMIFHLILNLLIQPLSFQQMRREVLKVRTDIASQMVQAGSFVSPAPELTVYARDVKPDGEIFDVLIRDARDLDAVSTHMAESGYIKKAGDLTILIMQNGSIQTTLEDGGIDIVDFETYQVDLSDVVVLDTVLRLKSSDQFLHVLLRPNPREYLPIKTEREYKSEGHARLAAPLYNIGLVLLALCFLTRGSHQKLGYSRKIAICAVIGFGIRLVGFAVASASESDSDLNIGQYLVPLLLILLCLIYLNKDFFRKPKPLNISSPKPASLQ